MPHFDETKQEKKLETIRAHEEEELAKLLSQKYSLTYIDLSREPVNTDALRLIPEEKARAAEVAAFQKSGKKIILAVRSPNNQNLKELLDDLEKRGYTTSLAMCSLPSLTRAWSYYKDISFAVETEAGVLDVSGDEIGKLLDRVHTLDAARAAIDEVLHMKRIFRITRTLETVMASALSNGASDVHMEPEENQVRIRFRLDGVLVDILMYDHDTYHLLLSRVKLLSGLKLNVKDAPQDGRFSIHIDKHEIEIRTSVLPGNYGESLVLRLLDPATIGVSLTELGINERLLTALLREIKKPNGMVLNTGPTGSGKTTTLYAFLKHVLDPGMKILTIEDPVEYHLEGIVQTQVNHEDYTFAAGLRSALRQDPDIIMVGEIRDKEVATTAVQAALTGHLVFSTLHTNNAAGAFPRLIDLGVEPSTIGSAVNVVMAQRLVRRIDPRYSVEVPLEGEDKDFVERVLASLPNRADFPATVTHTYAPKPPEGETGYKGRVGVYEAIFMDRSIEDAVRKKLTTRELMEVAHPQGIHTLHQDALVKILTGMTSLEEIQRVLGYNMEFV